MKNLEKNRLYILIFYCILGALAGIFKNIFVIIGLLLIGSLLWPVLNRRFYKMDEFEMQITYRSGYYTYLVMILLLIIGAIGYEMNWEILKNISIHVLLEIFILVSVLVQILCTWIIKRFSKI